MYGATVSLCSTTVRAEALRSTCLGRSKGLCSQGSIQLFYLHNCLLLRFPHFCQKCAVRLAQVGLGQGPSCRSATTSFPAISGANHPTFVFLYKECCCCWFKPRPDQQQGSFKKASETILAVI